MKEVRIHIKKIFFGKQHKVNIPTAWNEVSTSQFIALAKMIFGISSAEEFFSSYLNVDKKIISRLSSFELFMLEKEITYINALGKGLNRFVLDKIPGTRFVAPGVNLEGVSLQQFMTADTFFSQFLMTDDLSFLDLLVASLYMRNNETFVSADKSQNVVDLKKNAALISLSAVSCRYAVLLNYIMIKEWLSVTYPHMFPKNEDEVSKKEIKVKAKLPNWLELFDSFVGDNIPAMQSYQSMPAMDAFRIINRRIKEGKKHGRN